MLNRNQLSYLQGYEVGTDFLFKVDGLCDCGRSAWLAWSPYKVGTHARDGWVDALLGRPRRIERH